jgi:membrane protein DedA with SNARE-associated domain
MLWIILISVFIWLFVGFMFASFYYTKEADQEDVSSLLVAIPLGLFNVAIWIGEKMANRTKKVD